ncbi:Uncharacterised protein [BD1-7 clade bacterium]|uniref:Uncharacterized protein n=1 Tax=BD1-7 clade bacterium TaxID=2029982 RepID=A0A5S9QVE3_9GAMM|nr:Uncharacterised protein [BD1-7 clade bacterium]CAA0122906.1 Uncharacterised protein [BD1-7 clade bacterium]
MEATTQNINERNYRIAVATQLTQDVMLKLIQKGITICNVQINDNRPVIRVEYSEACEDLKTQTYTRRPQHQRLWRAIEAGCVIEWNKPNSANTKNRNQ